MVRWLPLALLSACSYSADMPTDAAHDAARDAPPDVAPMLEPPAPPPKCSLTTPWRAPVLVSNVNTSPRTDQVTLDSTETEMFLATNVSDTATQHDFYRATRSSPTATWSAPTLVGLSTSTDDSGARITDDGLTLFVSADRPPDREQLLIATRPTRTSAFGALQSLANVNSSAGEFHFTINSDGTAIYYLSDRSGAVKLYRASRANPAVEFGTPDPIVVPNDKLLFSPWISKDGLVMYTGRWDGPSVAQGDIEPYVAFRTSTSDPFSTPTKIPELAVAGSGNWPGWVSDDLCRIYLISSRPGSMRDDFDVWFASRDPE